MRRGLICARKPCISSSRDKDEPQLHADRQAHRASCGCAGFHGIQPRNQRTAANRQKILAIFSLKQKRNGRPTERPFLISGVFNGLTDPWKLFACQHVNDSRPADFAFHDHRARIPVDNFSDYDRAFAKRMSPHCIQDFVCILRRNKREELSFVGNVKRI